MSESGNIQKVKAILGQSFEQAKPVLRNLHSRDIAAILEEISPETRAKIFSLLSVDKASEVLSEMNEDSNPGDLLLTLSTENAARIIEELNPDDAADLLAQIPYRDLRKIMARIGAEQNQVLEQLMTYPEDSAGGIMTTEVLAIPAYFTKHEALQEIIRKSEEMEDFYFVYVVDDRNHLMGVLSLKDLIKAKHDASVLTLVREDVVSVPVELDQEEVARVMKNRNLPAIPVVDKENRLLGTITFDDVMDVMEEESTEDILKIAGVSEMESLRGGWWEGVRNRLPWLLMNLITASLAGFVVSLFQNTLDQIVILASYMPIVAGVGGNGATQTLAVTIRRIATDGVPPKAVFRIVGKEVMVGITNGLILGAVIGLLAYGLKQNPLLGLVVFASMTGNMLIAGFAGSFVPLLFRKLGVDPAVASSILITPFTDVVGYTLLLGLSALLLL